MCTHVNTLTKRPLCCHVCKYANCEGERRDFEMETHTGGTPSTSSKTPRSRLVYVSCLHRWFLSIWAPVGTQLHTRSLPHVLPPPSGRRCGWRRMVSEATVGGFLLFAVRFSSLNIRKSPLFSKWLQTSYSQPDPTVLIIVGNIGDGRDSSSSFVQLLLPGDLVACRPCESSRLLCFVDGLRICFVLWWHDAEVFPR